MPRPRSSPTVRKPLAPGRLDAVAVIPARLQSTRIHEKALQDLGGAPLVVRVWERVRECEALREAWVATDSPRIADAVIEAGGEALLTSADHPSGLDRVAEAARILADPGATDSDPVIINVQGDEPFVCLAGLETLVSLFERPEVRMATLAAPFRDPEEAENPNRVKVVLDRDGRALYFSRAPIPHGYGPRVTPILHVGIYGYRRRTLLELAGMARAPLEEAERLEQLRALWNGIPIHVAVGDYHSIGIDTPEDLSRARARWAEGRNLRP